MAYHFVMTTVSRRDVLSVSAACAACACCGLSVEAEDVTAEQLTAIKLTADTKPPFDAGAIADFLQAKVYEQFARKGKLLIINKDQRVFASSSICPHKSCVVKLRGDKLVCPCHGSAFDDVGTVLNGPAKESLLRFAVSVKDGRLSVDRTKSFAERDWENAAAFVEIKP